MDRNTDACRQPGYLHHQPDLGDILTLSLAWAPGHSWCSIGDLIPPILLQHPPTIWPTHLHSHSSHTQSMQMALTHTNLLTPPNTLYNHSHPPPTLHITPDWCSHTLSHSASHTPQACAHGAITHALGLVHTPLHTSVQAPN